MDWAGTVNAPVNTMAGAAPVVDPALLDPAGVAALVGHGIPPSLSRRLLISTRFGARIAAAADRRIEMPTEKLTPAQAIVLRLDRFGLVATALKVGAIWHGKLIAKIISGPDVRNLVNAIGPELRNLALQYRDIAPELSDTPLAAVPDILEQQGVACLKAWCVAQPPAIARRMDLRLPRRPVPDQTHGEYGLKLVETVARKISA